MAQNSKIEWTHHTANLWHGCTKVHEGCDNCYAEALSHRWGNDVWGNDKPRKAIKSVWKDLAKYQELAKEAGETHRVFVGSMMDIFEKPMNLIDSKGEPIFSVGTSGQVSLTTDDLRQLLFDLITRGKFDNLMFLFLTKRPSNINKYIPESWKLNPPKNVMFGTSPVNQKTAHTLIPQLAKVKGKRFISVEPQLSEVDLTEFAIDGDVINGRLIDWVDWVIVGGESGHHKRNYNTDWGRIIRDDCQALSVPFFFKQIDKVQLIPDDLLIREFP
jgi:protein gp37